MKRKVRLISEAVRDSFIRDIEEMPTDGSHQATYSEFKSKRSLEQNSYLHKLLQDIAEFTGDSLASTKYDMKAEFLVPISRRQMNNGDWQVEYPSTADMSVKDLAEFCEKIEAFAMTTLGFVRAGI